MSPAGVRLTTDVELIDPQGFVRIACNWAMAGADDRAWSFGACLALSSLAMLLAAHLA
jgi:hypothetical protein